MKNGYDTNGQHKEAPTQSAIKKICIGRRRRLTPLSFILFPASISLLVNISMMGITQSQQMSGKTDYAGEYDTTR